MRNALVGAATVVLVAACGNEPEDPARDAWVGVYRGTLSSESRDCATGERLEPFADDLTLELVPVGSSRIAIDGACLIEFDLLGDGDGRLRPTSCESALTDGTPIRYTYVSGRAELDGDELYLDLPVKSETPEWCDTSFDIFVGFRQ